MDEDRALETHVTSDIGSFAMLPLWVLEAGISPRAIQCLGFLLAKFADRAMECYPSRRALAEMMNTSPDTVDRALAELRELGVISTEERRASNGSQTSNLIHIRLSRPAPVRTHAQPPTHECPPPSAPMPTPLGTSADPRTIPNEPYPMNHSADASEALPLFVGQPTPPTSKKTRRGAQSAQSDSDPVIRTPGAVKLRESDLVAIREEFKALRDLDACIQRCMDHVIYRTSANKPRRLREWLQNDLNRQTSAQSAQARAATAGPPKAVPYWEEARRG